jgi:prepilin-type processing-associated H-X9-DG protein
MSILLPALNKAREQARMIKCASNMKQIYLAMAMYAGENKSKMPIPPLINNNNIFDDWLGIVMVQVGVYDYRKGSMLPYLATSPTARQEAFNCPTDEDAYRPVRQSTMNDAAGFARNFTYSFNAGLRAEKETDISAAVPPGIRLGQIVHPAEKIIIIEEEWPNDGCAFIGSTTNGGTTAANNEDDVFTKRHLKRGNQGFADGHVEQCLPQDYGFDTNGTVGVNTNLRLKYCNLFYQF